MITSQSSEAERPGGPGPVRRIMVRWDGQEWSVVSEVRVASMTLPAPDPLPAGDASRGFWVELVGADGRIHYREVMADPLAGMEQFEEHGEVTRLAHPPHDVAVELLVPDVADSEIHLVSNPAHPGSTREDRPKRSILSLSSKSREGGKGQPPSPPDHHHH